MPLITFGFEEGLVKSIGNLEVHVDFSIENLDTKDIDVFIIPGGEPKLFISNEELKSKIDILTEKLRELNDQEKLIAAICGGSTFLAFSGLLDNKRCTGSIAEDE